MANNSRESILNRLQAAPRPFAEIAKNAPASRDDYLPVSSVPDSEIRARFIQEAELLSCQVHQPQTDTETLTVLLEILAGDDQVIAWDPQQIPFPSLGDLLQENNIRVADPGDPAVRVGISGVDAALAATGSLIVASNNRHYRGASLLPEVHVALIAADQILPNFESWIALQRQDKLESFRSSSNIVVISGPSRTADIAMELILGMHGPRTVHIILLPVPSSNS